MSHPAGETAPAVAVGRSGAGRRRLLWLAFIVVTAATLFVATVRPGPVLCPGLKALLHPDPESGTPRAGTVGFACDTDTCRAIDAAPTTAPGRFTAGEADLTGDGLLERVTLSGTQVSIDENGALVWESPPEWTVVDVALGDPNHDGRGELLVAFWKDDSEGIARSHPFIIGYRGGIYRTLWGGSPVAEAISELALGDVDGDGEDDLVVLDYAEDSDLTVSVWRWHGWGFSLMWRSAPGAYRDLILVPGEDGAPSTIVAVLGP